MASESYHHSKAVLSTVAATGRIILSDCASNAVSAMLYYPSHIVVAWCACAIHAYRPHHITAVPLRNQPYGIAFDPHVFTRTILWKTRLENPSGEPVLHGPTDYVFWRKCPIVRCLGFDAHQIELLDALVERCRENAVKTCRVTMSDSVVVFHEEYA
ncbi:hypothetical protein IQ07DRAFT_419959 [Pyrenochaeta sp. DS3sAY3a]|nr:hypothetical protein IQ07DRAFT_419959 [Pyrenochaeta sp. DS3sAY3a]